MDITIREYEPHDEASLMELIEIYNKYFRDIDPWKALQYSENAEKYYLCEMIKHAEQNGKFYVAITNNEIIGFIQGQLHIQTEAEIMERGHYISGDVREFFVVEEFRSKGVGTALMQKMEDFFIANNCRSIMLDVFAPNKLARDFYQNWGFTERALILVKRLPHN